jgi:hypothetical protein
MGWQAREEARFILCQNCSNQRELEAEPKEQELDSEATMAMFLRRWRVEGQRVQEAKEMRFSSFEKRIFKETGFMLLLVIGAIIWDVKFRKKKMKKAPPEA